MEKNFTRKNTLPYFLSFLTFLLLSGISSAQWTRKSDGIIARSEVVSVDYKGKMYVFFGFRDSLLHVVEPSAEVYDPATDTWKLLAAMPPEKAATHTGVAQLNDMVWHVGGRVGKHPAPLTNEIWIYNIGTDTWSQGPSLIDPATGKALPWAAGGAAFVGRTLHVFGGFIYNACENDQSTYHLTLDVDEWLANPTQPAKWKNVLAPMPVKRNHLSTVVLGGKIYALGGQFGHDCSSSPEQQYSHVFNPATNTWTELPRLPMPRSHTEGSIFAIDGKIYIVGGQTTSANSNLVTIFDPAANNGAGAWWNDNNLTLPLMFETLAAKVIGTTFVISHGGQPRFNNPRKATYTNTIARNPVYKFGFLPACSNLTVNAGSSAKAKTLLFTIDGSKDYTLSSNAGWLTITRNAAGTAVQNAVDVEATVNTAGLAPGKYTGIITVTGTGAGPAYTTAQYCVNLTVPGTTSSGLYEAENAQLYRVVATSKNPGYTGTGFVDYINATGDYVEWTVNQASAGPVTLQVRYANGSSADRPLKLEVNGVVVTSSFSFRPTGSWRDWSTTSFATKLNAGTNKIRITANGSSGANVDHLKVVTSTTLEAESALQYRAIVANNHAGYTGTGFVDYINATGDYVEWTVNQASAGPVTLQVRYANGSSADRPLKLEINGAVITNALSFKPTGGWANWSTVSVSANLNAGTNKVRLTANGYSGANVDHLSVLPNEMPLSAAAPMQMDKISETPTSAEDLRMSVAPNPVSNIARLVWNKVSDGPVEIRITDASGTIRRSFSLRNNNNGQFDFSVSDLPNGLYIIFARQGAEQVSIKLLVKRN